MKLVLLSSDLMLASGAQGAAAAAGAELQMAANAEAAVTSCVDDAAQVVVVDLRAPGLDVHALVTRLREAAPGVHVIACGPHVHEASLAAAAKAGCDEVVTRGEFERRLRAALAKLAD